DPAHCIDPLNLGTRPLHTLDDVDTKVEQAILQSAAAITFSGNCVALLHQSPSKRQLQITIGIDWAPRPTQPDLATWERVGGSIARPRIRVWVSQRAPSSQFTPLHWGRE